HGDSKLIYRRSARRPVLVRFIAPVPQLHLRYPSVRIEGIVADNLRTRSQFVLSGNCVPNTYFWRRKNDANNFAQ
ncbi:MAG: hypothetical protein QM330_13275, partial [Acidobacteriota bacterium]|nr:hypothetical protein [Acidobacteriota bacterium]